MYEVFIVMNYSVLFGLTLFVAACGGNTSIVSPNGLSDIGSIEQIYSASGGKVSVVKGDLESSKPNTDAPKYYFIFSQSPEVIIEDLKNGSSWDKKLDLNNSGSEFVASKLYLQNNNLHSITVGSASTIIPSGKALYNGDLTIGVLGKVENSNELTLVADFNSEKVSISGFTNSFELRAQNLQIDPVSATFYGTDGTINKKSDGTVFKIDIAGAFAGETASAVHGIGYADQRGNYSTFTKFLGTR